MSGPGRCLVLVVVWSWSLSGPVTPECRKILDVRVADRQLEYKEIHPGKFEPHVDTGLRATWEIKIGNIVSLIAGLCELKDSLRFSSFAAIVVETHRAGFRTSTRELKTLHCISLWIVLEMQVVWQRSQSQNKSSDLDEQALSLVGVSGRGLKKVLRSKYLIEGRRKFAPATYTWVFRRAAG